MRIFRLMTCLRICVVVNFGILVITITYLLGGFVGKNVFDWKNQDSTISDLESQVTRTRDGNEIHRIFAQLRRDPEPDPELETDPNGRKITPEEAAPTFPVFNSVSFKQTSRNLQHKIVHIDLKGAPPKMHYLISLLPELQKAGATGILLEYEDMFPYDGQLEKIKAKNAYKRRDLLAFLQAAQVLDLDVIPLVQTFGHLQFLLKLKEYRHLREEDEHPDSICPMKMESKEVIQEMLRQVYELHNQIHSLKWMHIGCDEVYHINQCEMCQKRNISNRQIFTEHVTSVANFVKTLHPTIVPLIWDDMLRSFPATELLKSPLKGLVQPVVWIYGDTITSLVQHRIWYTYVNTFDKIWIASAYKGASGATKTIPDLQKHYKNHLAWLEFATGYKVAGTKNELYNFEGIFLTGWSRYDHFSVLCEMLPPSLPSLYLNLLLVNSYLSKQNTPNRMNEIDDSVFRSWWKMLKCPDKSDLRVKSSPKKNYNYLTKFEEYLRYCNFDGGKIYDDLRNLLVIESEVHNFLIVSSFKTDGLLQYNLDHRIFDVEHLTEVTEKARRLDMIIDEMTKHLTKHLKDFFDDSTVNEFVEYKLVPLKTVVGRVLNIIAGKDEPRIWDTRPFKSKNEV